MEERKDGRYGFLERTSTFSPFVPTSDHLTSFQSLNTRDGPALTSSDQDTKLSPIDYHDTSCFSNLNPDFFFMQNHETAPVVSIPQANANFLSGTDLTGLDSWLETLNQQQHAAEEADAWHTSAAATNETHAELQAGDQLYQNAYYNWLASQDYMRSDQPYYNPFGSDDVFVHHTSRDTVTTHVPDATGLPLDQKAVGSHIPKVAKPTFAEVARNRPLNSENRNIRTPSPGVAFNQQSNRNLASSQKHKSHLVSTGLGQTFQYVTSRSSSQEDTCSSCSSKSADQDNKPSMSRKDQVQPLKSQAGGDVKNVKKPIKPARSQVGHKVLAEESKKKESYDSPKFRVHEPTKVQPRPVWSESQAKKDSSQPNNPRDQLNDKQKNTSDKKCLIDSIPQVNTLNNAASSSDRKYPVKPSSATFINNDLRNVRNQPSEPFVKHSKGKLKQRKVNPSSQDKATTSVRYKIDNKCPVRDGPSQFEVAYQKLVELLAIAWVWTKWGCIEGVMVLNNFMKGVASSASILLAIFMVYLYQLARSAWDQVKVGLEYLRRKWRREKDGEGGAWSKETANRQKIGLKENITLPSTGQEAMKRLLSCKGKDPYSILGVRHDTSDDEIKRYYRRQAVLVHPDKNQEPGAEEAFKTLGHAFDLIGTEDKRQQYHKTLEMEDAETAMEEFADLLSKLNDKIKEAANLLHCDKCGGQHRRVLVNRPTYAARFCRSCDTHHQAKEGDIWAESKILGFYWHYYACMEGKIFDITEWVSCKRDDFKSMLANGHQVFYKLSNTGHRGRRNETSLEDIIQDLLSQSGQAQGDGAEGATSHKGSTNSRANFAKGKKKKKQRH